MPYLGFFGLEVSIKYCHISNQHYQMCLIEKFCEETKKSNFGTKMPYLSHSKLAPSNLSNCKILWNNQNG